MVDHRTRWTSDRLRDGGAIGTARPRLLLLCDYRPFDAATVIDHIEAIRAWSRYDVFVLPMLGDLPDELDLQAFACVVVHYSLVMANDAYLSPLARWRINRFAGVKAAFVQDEYRFVNDTVAAMGALGINVLFTCVSSDQVETVYPSRALPALRRSVTVLTGYVPDHLLTRPVVPYERRHVDVAYRGRALPPWLGSLARQKVTIADRFAAESPAYGLTVDISCREEDRIYGEAWIGFIGGAKATLGVESGASVFDFDGSIERAVRDYLAVTPHATFEELHERYLNEVDGRIRLNQISPRSFEAAALGTLMVLYRGEYSGILEAWRHYVPLEFDHSNMADVVDAIRDRETWERITSQAREEVALNPSHSFRAMVGLIDDALDLQPAAQRPPVDAGEFESIAAASLAKLRAVHLNAGGGPTPTDRLRLVGQRIASGLKPNPVIASPYDSGRGRLRRIRSFIRHARAFVYWTVTSRRLAIRTFGRHPTPLLDDLSDLAQLQIQGARAVRSGADSPFVLSVDNGTGHGRITLRTEALALDPSRVVPSHGVPPVSGLSVHLASRWLGPATLTTTTPRRFAALSEVLRARPDVGRRLLVGRAVWCTTEVRADSDRRPTDLPHGGDVKVETH